MSNKIKTGDQLILLREEGNITYTVGEFYFEVHEVNGCWCATVEMIGPEGTAQYDVELILDCLKRVLMCRPENVKFCEELLRLRKEKDVLRS